MQHIVCSTKQFYNRLGKSTCLKLSFTLKHMYRNYNYLSKNKVSREEIILIEDEIFSLKDFVLEFSLRRIYSKTGPPGENLFRNRFSRGRHLRRRLFLVTSIASKALSDCLTLRNLCSPCYVNEASTTFTVLPQKLRSTYQVNRHINKEDSVSFAFG